MFGVTERDKRPLEISRLHKAVSLANQITKDMIEIQYTNAARPSPNNLFRIGYLIKAVRSNLPELSVLLSDLQEMADHAVDNFDDFDYTERKEQENDGCEDTASPEG